MSALEIIKKRNKDFPIAVSIGITITNKNNTYENLFKKADDALYTAKRNGGSQIIVYGKNEPVMN